MKNRRKPRTAVDRKVNQKLQSFGTECEWWDGGYPECFLPWARKCKGNPFICKKLYYQHLASAKKISREALLDFEQREKIDENLDKKSNSKTWRILIFTKTNMSKICTTFYVH